MEFMITHGCMRKLPANAHKHGTFQVGEHVEVLAEWFLGEGMEAPSTYLVPSTSSDSHLYPL